MAPGLSLRELELGEDGIHIATRPSMAFHGKLQVALAEASSLIDEGYRVVFFSPSAGEVERLADVCQEYGVPFQLGMETSRATPQYLAERAYLGSSMASAFLVKGGVRHGVTHSATGLRTRLVRGPGLQGVEIPASPVGRLPSHGALRLLTNRVCGLCGLLWPFHLRFYTQRQKWRRVRARGLQRPVGRVP